MDSRYDFFEKPIGNVEGDRIVNRDEPPHPAEEAQRRPEGRQEPSQGPRPARAVEQPRPEQRADDDGISPEMRERLERRRRAMEEGQAQRLKGALDREPERPRGAREEPRERQQGFRQEREEQRPGVPRENAPRVVQQQPKAADVKKGRERMILPPRLMDQAPRGFIGAQQLYERKAGLLTVPGVVFFTVDVVTSTFGIVTLYKIIADQPAPLWVYGLGLLLALYAIYMQMTAGPFIWHCLRNKLRLDWVDVVNYVVHAAPDIVGTAMFFWILIAIRLIRNLSDGNPTWTALAIGVALCILIAVLCSVMPVVILIRHEQAAEGAEDMR